MINLLSVDPGTRITGVAWWENGVLLDADNLREKTPYKMVTAVSDFARGRTVVCDLVLEFPEVYSKWSKVDPNDLMTLAAFCGAVDHEMHRIFNSNTWKYLPKDWKGQLPKKVTKNRALAILSDTERKIPALREAKALDVWDAVGLGLHHLGRHLP